MFEVGQGREPDTLELKTSSSHLAYVFKPTELSLHHIPAEPAQSFFFLSCAPLNPTGVYDWDVTGIEEVVETVPLEFHPREVLDRGFLGYAEDGEEIPLPSDYRLTIRFLSGALLLVSKGSYWNGSPNTYGGEHADLGPEGVRRRIERKIVRPEQPF